MTLSELTDLIRWGWANDRTAALIPVSGAAVSGLENPRVTQEREWTRWSDQRPPNAQGVYRYRASFDLLGLPVTAEWEEEMHLCGMGYSDSEWWPLSPCYWNGYRRYITNETLEWSSVHAYDQPGIVWHGLDLLPCPFTGKAPTVEAQGRFIGAPLWQSEAVWIGSPAVPKRCFTDAKAMVTAWNTRHREAAEAASKAREAALVEALTPSGDTKAAYHGEFSFQLFRGVSDAGIDQYEKVYVPWTNVKEIMAAISARAALAKEPDA